MNEGSSSLSFFIDSTLTFFFTPRTWRQARKTLTAHCILCLVFSGIWSQMTRSTSSPVRLSPNRRSLSSCDSWKSSASSKFVRSKLPGRTHFQFTQAVLNMKVDRGETVHRLDEVSRGKDAHRGREIVWQPETTRGKVNGTLLTWSCHLGAPTKAC